MHRALDRLRTIIPFSGGRVLSVLMRYLGRPEWLFLALALPSGMVLAVLIPPFEGADEYAHACRAFTLSQLKILPERERSEEGYLLCGGRLPGDVCDVWREMASVGNVQDPERSRSESPWEAWSHSRPQHARDALVFVQFANTAVQPPLPYVFQAIAMGFARGVGGSAVAILLAARLVNLLTYSCLVFAALRCTPSLKWPFFLVGLMPRAILLAAVVDTDAFINGFFLLFFGLVLRLVGETNAAPSRIRQECAALAALILLAPFCKIVYTPLCGLACLIPMRRLGGARQWIRWQGLFATFMVAGAACASAYTRWAYEPYRHESIELAVDSALKTLLAEPLKYLWALVPNTIRLYAVIDPLWLEQLVGPLRWGTFFRDYYTPGWFVLLYLGALACSSMTCDISMRWRHIRARVVVLLCATSCALGVITSMYIYVYALSDEAIEGVQGRYFIPLVPCAFLLLASRPLRLPGRLDRWFRGAWALLAIGGLFLSFYAVYTTYYAGHPSLIPNSEFGEWPEGAPAPTGWSIGKWETSEDAPFRIQREEGAHYSQGVAVRQQWLRNPESATDHDRFGVTISGLKPCARYELWIRGQWDADQAAWFSAWELSPDGETNRLLAHSRGVPVPSGSMSTETACLHARVMLIVAGRSGIVRLEVSPNTAYGTNQEVIWDAWKLTERHAGIFWRRWFCDCREP